MNAPMMLTHGQRSLIYEIYDRHTKVVMGRVQVKDRRELEMKHPWVKDHIKEASEASGSVTGVRYIGETPPASRLSVPTIRRQ